MRSRLVVLALSSLPLLSPVARAYDSGSTGADGALCVGDKIPSVDGLTCVDGSPGFTETRVVTLPPSGILNYTAVYVGIGSTLKFVRNQANTPVYLLATGDVTLYGGTIDVSGGAAVCAYSAGYTPSQAADLLCWGGLPGPGGDAGGSIGPVPWGASWGLGPDAGGAAGGDIGDTGADACVGSGGAGPTVSGQDGGCRTAGPCKDGGEKLAGPGWKLTHGGSGGGGAFTYWGTDPASSGEVEGGGGGGGAIVIASSTRIDITNAYIFANGGARGQYGGGGAGGLIRLVADVVSSAGGISYLQAYSSCQYGTWATTPFCSVAADLVAACGAPGIIEIETLDQSTLNLSSNPADVYFAAPRRALPWGDDPAQQPSLTITEVQGFTVPPLPVTVHPHRHPVLTLPAGVVLTVKITGKYVPDDAAVKVGLNTLGRGRAVVSAGFVSGTLASSLWQAQVTVPADARLGDLQAWVKQITVPE